MNAQKEIKKMAKILDKAECVEDALFVDFDGMAKALINAGYGDAKQAVRDFAEKVKEKIDEMVENWTFAVFNVQDAIDELVKEVCGE